MKYKSYMIVKSSKIENGTFVDNGYDVFEPFNRTTPVTNVSSSEEAKAWIDERAIEVTKGRYGPVHYSRYWWAVSDNENGGLYVRQYDDRLLLFHTAKEALSWCKEHN